MVLNGTAPTMAAHPPPGSTQNMQEKLIALCEAQNWRCCYCGVRMLTQPRSHGLAGRRVSRHRRSRACSEAVRCRMDAFENQERGVARLFDISIKGLNHEQARRDRPRALLQRSWLGG